MGIVTPFGHGTEALWRGLVERRGCFAPHAALVGTRAVDGRPGRAAAVPDEILPAAVLADDRTLALCEAALDDLLGDPVAAGLLAATDRTRVGVCLASTQGAITRWERAQRARAGAGAGWHPAPPHSAGPLVYVAERLGARGPRSNPALACASGIAAVGIASDWIAQGRCDLVVCGGADALSTMVYRGFDALRAVDPEAPRPFDADRAGMGLGEGAALLLLAPADATSSDAEDDPVYVAGWGLACDARHLTAPDPEGVGLARAIAAALEAAGLPPGAIGHVNAHGTATVFNDLAEAHALARSLGAEALAAAPVSSIKGAVGHGLAAAGALEAVVCRLALQRGQAPPTAGLTRIDPAIAALGIDVIADGPRPLGPRRAVLSTAAGFGGIDAALLLRRGRPRPF